MITISALAEKMDAKGYKVTPTTIKYYVSEGLLPPTDKMGGYREGVKSFFDNEEEVVERLTKIFQLKGRGFKLAEIRAHLREADRAKAIKIRAEFLKRFRLFKNEYVLEIDDFHREASRIILADSFSDAFQPSNIDMITAELQQEWSSQIFHPITDWPSRIESLGLFRLTTVHEDKFAIRLDQFRYASYWVAIHREYMIAWDVLDAINKKHIQNFDTYIMFPEIDNKRFTAEHIGYLRQSELNYFGITLHEYLKSIKSSSTHFFRSGYNEQNELQVQVDWDSEYDDVNIFIDDFLHGRCAFVHQLIADGPTLFLRRL